MLSTAQSAKLSTAQSAHQDLQSEKISCVRVQVVQVVGDVAVKAGWQSLHLMMIILLEIYKKTKSSDNNHGHCNEGTGLPTSPRQVGQMTHSH